VLPGERPAVLRFWRDWVRGTPEELCTVAVFAYAPPEPFVPPDMRFSCALRVSSRASARAIRTVALTDESTTRQVLETAAGASHQLALTRDHLERLAS